MYEVVTANFNIGIWVAALCRLIDKNQPFRETHFIWVCTASQPRTTVVFTAMRTSMLQVTPNIFAEAPRETMAWIMNS